MNQQSIGQQQQGQTPEQAAATGGKQEAKFEAVAGPFTIRDLAVFAATVILFVASLLPMFAARYNLWNLGSLFFLGLGIVLPLVVSALFAARRLSPGTKLRIGSLSVDQFGSVVASFAVAFFFLSVAGAYVPSLLVALVGAIILFAATVLGRFIPYFAQDFLNRTEVPAHVVARDSAVPVHKPKAPKEPKAAKTDKAPAPAAPSPAARTSAPAEVGTGAFSATAGRKAEPEPHTAAWPAAGAAAGATATGAGAAGAGVTATGAGAAAAGAPAAGAPATAADAGASVPAAGAAARTASEPQHHGSTRLDRHEDAQAAGAAAPATGRTGVVPSAAEQTQAAQVVPGTAGGAASAGNGHASAAAMPTVANPQVRVQEPIGATVDPDSRRNESRQEPAYEAFWFAVPQPRTAYDERTGAPAFGIEPGGWVLALEDRGHEFLVQHTDGRLGVLRDLTNIERG